MTSSDGTNKSCALLEATRLLMTVTVPILALNLKHLMGTASLHKVSNLERSDTYISA